MNKEFFLFLICFLLLSCNETSLSREPRKDYKATKPTKKNEKIISGKVVGISDGDTFKLLLDGNQTIRVRLHGVDAPEKGQDYASQAKEKLSELLFSKLIKVQEKDIDRYGRTVGIVYVDNLNVNEELLRSGLVWHYTQYDKNEAWAELTKQAERNKKGLWNKANPIPPWEWRKQKREAAAMEQ